MAGLRFNAHRAAEPRHVLMHDGHAQAAPGNVCHLPVGGNARAEDQLPRVLIPQRRRRFGGNDARVNRRRLDRRHINPRPVVGNLNLHLARRLGDGEGQLARRGFPQSRPLGQRLDAMIHRVPHQMHERVLDLFENALINLDLGPVHGELDFLPGLARQVVNHFREAGEDGGERQHQSLLHVIQQPVGEGIEAPAVPFHGLGQVRDVRADGFRAFALFIEQGKQAHQKFLRPARDSAVAIACNRPGFDLLPQSSQPRLGLGPNPVALGGQSRQRLHLHRPFGLRQFHSEHFLHLHENGIELGGGDADGVVSASGGWRIADCRWRISHWRLAIGHCRCRCRRCGRRRNTATRGRRLGTSLAGFERIHQTTEGAGFAMQSFEALGGKRTFAGLEFAEHAFELLAEALDLAGVHRAGRALEAVRRAKEPLDNRELRE